MSPARSGHWEYAVALCENDIVYTDVFTTTRYLRKRMSASFGFIESFNPYSNGSKRAHKL